jgi:hypothetical protein
MVEESARRPFSRNSSSVAVICVSFISSIYGPAGLVQAGALRFTYNICQVLKVCIKLMAASCINQSENIRTSPILLTYYYDMRNLVSDID